ncbi:hypothetical protein HAX54_048445, partial [Datura stramonium]|nr:hypothetical protein [Datura stramonium]
FTGGFWSVVVEESEGFGRRWKMEGGEDLAAVVVFPIPVEKCEVGWGGSPAAAESNGGRRLERLFVVDKRRERDTGAVRGVAFTG